MPVPPEIPMPDANSLWQHTAGPRPAFPPPPDERFDVAVVGGGYTGLNAALHLAEKGLRPVVLEANRIGWGASGRNGGVVSTKFRIGLPEVARRLGRDAALRMRELGLEAVRHVGELVERFDIRSADYRPTGSLRCAHNQRAFHALRAEADWLRRELGDTTNIVLGPEETARETGSTAFAGALLTGKGGIIHPLNFVFGVAAGLRKIGVAIAEHSPVDHIRREAGDMVLVTPRGHVRAGQIVVATDAYSHLTGATGAAGRAVIPFRSAIVATEPIAGTAAEGLLPTDRSYAETRRMMRWFRKSDGRMLYGGRGAFGTRDSDAAFRALESAMKAQFPELAALKVTHRWSGLVALTLDKTPFVGRTDDRTTVAVGYNGAGVAMSSLMGKHAAEIVVGGRPDLALLGRPLAPIRFYGLREPVVRAATGWLQLLDRIGR